MILVSFFNLIKCILKTSYEYFILKVVTNLYGEQSLKLGCIKNKLAKGSKSDYMVLLNLFLVIKVTLYNFKIVDLSFYVRYHERLGTNGRDMVTIKYTKRKISCTTKL